jgi:hypothetical protein
MTDDRIRDIADKIVESIDDLENVRAAFHQLSRDDQETVLRALAARGTPYTAWVQPNVLGGAG